MVGGAERRTARSRRRVLDAIDRAIRWAADTAAFRAQVPAVSGWSVGEHLEHLLLSDGAIVGWLEGIAEGDTPESQDAGGSNWRGRIVLATGFIPRGKGRAPDFARPEGRPRERVEAGLREVRERVDRLGPALGAIVSSRAAMRHPALGRFRAAQWLRFAALHHSHHEKIVREILRAAATADRPPSVP